LVHEVPGNRRLTLRTEVSRSCVRAQNIWAGLLTHVIEPAGFVMTRRMLLGIKQRAEALASAGAGESRGTRPNNVFHARFMKVSAQLDF
jgi:hypothetical protein